MPVWNLPQFKDGLPPPGAGGTLAPIAELETLANNLTIPSTPLTQRSIRSVPDPWAQVLLSTEVLVNRPAPGEAIDPLQADIEARWRALIATVALQHLYSDSYRLSVIPLPAAGHRLRALLLGKLKPRSLLADAADWATDVGIVQLARMTGGRPDETTLPIGIAVPDIILAPGRNFDTLRLTGVPWLEDGPKDPMKVALSADARATLGDFANGLADSAERLAVIGQPERVQKGVVGALRSLGQEAADPHALPRELRRTSLGWPGSLASALNDISGVKVGSGESECRLELRGDLADSPFRSIILADPAIAATLGRPASSIRLFDSFVLSDAKTRLAAIKAAAQKAGHLVVGVDDLLTMRLARIKNGSVAIHAGEASGYLLPITPAALLIDLGEKLAAAAILENRGGEITAGVKLRLSGNREHRLVRNYPRREVEEVDRLDDLGLWPNFRADGWKHYAVRAQFRSKLELSLLVPASGALLLADLGPQPHHRLENWIAANVLSAPAEEVQRLGKDAASLTQFRFPSTTSDNPFDDLIGVQSWSTAAPEALFMGWAGQPVGCIVPQLGKVVDTPKSATVAIDFGTSNTIVRADIDKQPQDHETLGARVVHPISPLPEAERYGTGERVSFLDFFPIDGSDMPFPTILKTRNALAQNLTGVIGATEFIFFADPSFATKHTAKILNLVQDGCLKSNIKWDGSGNGKRLKQQFLSQLMLMVSAELVSKGVMRDNIQWNFSFPNAFDGETRIAFRTAMETAIGNVVGRGFDAKKIGIHSEAKAAMESLVGHGGAHALSNLLILLDIGGGTTDIAIWHGTSTVWQQSFRLAAREFFTAPLARRPVILEDSFGALDEATKAQMQRWRNAQPNTVEEEYGRALCELLINRPDFGDKFREAQAVASNPAWRELQKVASLALGGMLWFLGRQYRASETAWKVPVDEFAGVTLALGGRGASYFRLIDPKAEGQLGKLAQLIASGARLPASPRIHFSAKPKREVVDGLITLGPGTQEMNAGDDSTIIGLGITESQREHAADTSLKNFGDSSLSAPQIHLEEFQTFLDDFRNICGFSVDLTSTAGTGSSGTLEARLKTAVRMRLQQGDFSQPPFIVALGELVRELAR